jgi:hypothetical protein
MKTKMFLAALAASVPAYAHAATFTICVRANIQTTDSGIAANGLDEDYYQFANQAGGFEVVGRGFRVQLTQGAWSDTFDSDPTNGCFSVVRNSANGFGVRVYGFATDDNGNHVRIHSAGTDTASWYPGATYSAVWSNQTLSSSGTNSYVLDGVANDRFTTIAAAAFGIHRYHGTISDKTISFGFVENDCDNSGSTHGSAERYIESDDAHLIRIGRCNPGDPDTREKMLITHELGHAIARLHFGYDGDDILPTGDQEYVPPVGTPAACVNVGSYGMRSLEYNSQTFKEGFADFYSSRVWNAKDSRGTYVYRQTAYDLEQWDTSGGGNTSGGVKVNVCNNNTSNVATKGDWLRFFWDWYNANCASQPSDNDMLTLYRMVRENDRTGTYNANYLNFDNATVYAIENSIAGLSDCEIDVIGEYMDWNSAD